MRMITTLFSLRRDREVQDAAERVKRAAARLAYAAEHMTDGADDTLRHLVRPCDRNGAGGRAHDDDGTREDP